ncbi:1,4-dihydroxy-2-naphthoate octaprenyltransferase [Boudabousia tangfeifanii]|uniref:1,4-dihydroxy-2-naphthoate octaprenyltransferase n=1 Tax=Boudabousia tangfeifanii TaxID=1912795 RepID=A0A1D9MLJ7_9ACTO|nr:1,4-dihydroxy-2-naphthoate polyprenyltransferase [Boudabousia tangfeifanii]AOZ73166.1 1,4-dihydroxy-2-naphthoate octaprenyltransferase [Boudabousia tangfeifanii]
MATTADWIEGARPKTLPAAAAPVMIGASAAFYLGGFSFFRTLLALLVALSLQIGVNFSNDYSDGIRGTDEHRTGPARLTGGKLAKPSQVLAAALACFALAGVLGLILIAVSGTWWLLLAGVAAVLAAWFYTGGKHPYGYYGFGEIMVITFFGFLATIGTTWTQIPQAPWWLWLAAFGVGLLSADLLMINNIRDIPTDKLSGKKTLAVRLGNQVSRGLFVQAIWVAIFLGIIVILGTGTSINWGGLALFLALTVPFSYFTIRPVVKGAQGRALIVVLKNTGLLTLLYALGLSLSLASAW